MKLTNSSKYNDVAGAILSLKGVVSVQDIIDAIKQIANFQKETLDKIEKVLSSETLFNKFDTNYHEKLSNIKVDMTYQRRVRLRKLLNKLTSAGRFDPHGAGAIDIAMRGNNPYVWDGLRRCIMAGIVGLDYIPVSRFNHSRNTSVIEMQQTEARFFKMRNADTETMKPEEIFKSMVVYNDPNALKILNVLKNAELDVEGLNPGHTTLSGFRELQNKLFSKVEEEEIKTASGIIRRVFNNDNVVSSYLLCGLALLIQKNEELDKPLADTDIESQLTTWKTTKTKPSRSQKTLTSRRLNSKASESIAWNISEQAVNFNGQQKELVNLLNLDKSDVDILEDIE
tara:strand:+ start:863 stop:1885 length:1023 start_codon:yes stop_codon:yes gene_type:complete